MISDCRRWSMRCDADVPIRDDHFNLINGGFTVGIAVLAIGFVIWLHWRLRLWVEARLQGMVDKLKEELPPLFVGEYITRGDIEAHRKRLDELEALGRNVEDRLNLLMKKL